MGENLEIGDYVMYISLYGQSFLAKQVKAIDGKYVRFEEDFHNEYIKVSCFKNHIISGIYKKLSEDFKSMPFAAACLFKYAVATKDMKDIAILLDPFGAEFMENRYNLDYLELLFIRIIDSDYLALEFIYACLNNLFCLSNCSESVKPALNLFSSLRLHS